TAPARMEVHGGKGDEASTTVARETTLEEQIQEQCQNIDQLTSKLDQFIELMMNNRNNNGVPPPSVPQGVVEPQVEELQAGTLATAPPNQERQHEG
ncbi:hypothetical protein Q8G81_32745, partial [Klebsiella pneumoniae]